MLSLSSGYHCCRREVLEHRRCLGLISNFAELLSGEYQSLSCVRSLLDVPFYSSFGSTGSYYVLAALGRLNIGVRILIDAGLL